LILSEKKLEKCARSLCFRPEPDAPTIVDNSRKIPRIENVDALRHCAGFHLTCKLL